MKFIFGLLCLLLVSVSAFAYSPAGVPDFQVIDSLNTSVTAQKYDEFVAVCDAPDADSNAVFILKEAITNPLPRLKLEVLRGTLTSGDITMVPGTDAEAMNLPNHQATYTPFVLARPTTLVRHPIWTTWTIRAKLPANINGVIRKYTLFIKCTGEPATQHALTFTQSINQ